MQHVVDVIQQIARGEARTRPLMALGTVTSVRGSNGEKDHACTVALRDTGLVLPRVPIATGVIGAVALPSEGDLVAVLFAEGDYHDPIVIGRLYAADVDPPPHGPGEAVLSLPGGETADDKRIDIRVTTPGDGSRALTVTLDGSVAVEVEISDNRVRLTAQDATIEVQQTGGSDGTIRLEVGEAKAELKQNGDVSIETSGTLKLKANKVEISGDTDVKIAGTSVQLN